MSNDQKNKSGKKIYKSLYEVKDKYLPHADIEFLESKDDDVSREAFIQALKRYTGPDQVQSCEKK